MKKYTCNDYRQEMMLAGLRRRLAEDQMAAEKMDDEERRQLMRAIQKLESELGID